jgi:hypothetical protein
VNSGSNNVQILLGRGDGTFDLGSALTTQANPKDAAAGYFNDDELPDLAVVNYDDSSISVFINDDESGLPIRNEKGEYIVTKTVGMAGTQADVIKLCRNKV